MSIMGCTVTIYLTILCLSVVLKKKSPKTPKGLWRLISCA